MTTMPSDNPTSTEFAEMLNRVLSLAYAWKLFKQLFRNDHNVAVLNSSIPQVGAYLYGVCIDDILLQITRILDHHGEGPKSCFTLETLVLTKPISESSHECRYALRVRNIQNKSAMIKEHRNKRIAHTDHAIALGSTDLPPILFSSIENTIHRIQSLLASIAKRYYEQEISFDVCTRDDGNTLVFYLAMAKTYNELHFEALLSERPPSYFVDELKRPLTRFARSDH